MIVKKGGARLPQLIEKESDDSFLFMNRPEILNFTLERVPILINSVLKRNNIAKSRIDRFIFHPANKFILDALCLKNDIPFGKAPLHFQKFGNTVSSTIQMEIYEEIINNQVVNDEIWLFSGFGVGYSWDGVVLEINKYSLLK